MYKVLDHLAPKKGRRGMTDERTFTLADLKRMCSEFDESEGSYPEHEYEGEAFYSWVLWKIAQEAKR